MFLSDFVISLLFGHARVTKDYENLIKTLHFHFVSIHIKIFFSTLVPQYLKIIFILNFRALLDCLYYANNCEGDIVAVKFFNFSF